MSFMYFFYVEFFEDFFQWEDQDPALFEGDIMFSGDKNAILSSSYRWPNAKIPYEISNVYSKSTCDFTCLGHDFLSKRLFFSSCFSDSVSLGIQKGENPLPVLFLHLKLAQNISKTSKRQFTNLTFDSSCNH